MDSREKYLKVWTSERRFFSASQLKILACIFMLISHIGQTGYIYALGYPQYYEACVAIGRIAFPIFCFFIVQGVILTSNAKKYLLRLFSFALISEIPFDLAFYGGLNRSHQNVFFTLFLGAVLLLSLTYIENQDLTVLVKILFSITSLLIFMALAEFFNTDYSKRGIFAIFLLYLGKDKRIYTGLALLVGFYFEAYLYGLVYLSIVFIYLYNGQKGSMNKWVFYGFYPGHLLLLYFLMNYVTY